MRGTMMDFPLTLNTLLERAEKFYRKIEVVSRRPDKSLHRYTYDDFYRRARALAAALQKAGLQRGDRVATLMWNHWAHLEAYFGVPAAGGVVSIDPEGYIKIVDRTKDLVKSGGEWISSVDLENALMGHPAVKEAAVISLPHPKWVERPLAVVVLRNGASPRVEELRAFLAEKFSRWQLPDAIVFVPEIPRTSTGKFKKTALREQFANWKWE